MGVSGAARTPPEVVWHELECGSYRADLALWRKLADAADGPILDVGAGSGRVALELARATHAVTALDSDAALLTALRERAGASAPALETAHADARSFTLARADFALCIVPMQTIQLLGGGVGRLQFLRRARAHLRPGGVLACAILGELDPFDCSQSGIGPAAEQATRDGSLYVSRAIRVAETAATVVIERERRVLTEQAEPPRWPFPGEHEQCDGARERNVIELDKVTVATLRGEGAEAGLRPRPTVELAPTDEHVGSSVVMFSA